ncbi:MAG: nuclear transport factor 2 family protein [Acetobacteraceae bacterium]|nr:nuclear transport factor 2 family protein [Acetobacteraceae bacterium]
MNPLPEAPPAIRDAVHDWLDRFAACVREVDYAAAYPFWHPRILAFGTVQAVVEGLEPFRDRQWDSVWPRTSDFRFRLDATRVLASPDGGMAIAIAPFTSTGYHPDGTPFDRPGRTTLVMVPNPAGPEAWVAVHSHMSLAKGVPPDSHARRPVKAR